MEVGSSSGNSFEKYAEYVVVKNIFEANMEDAEPDEDSPSPIVTARIAGAMASDFTGYGK
jgi:hypothetical protein